MWKIQQVADLTGVTVRALRHYDKLGLLPPAQVTQAGYRLYGPAELDRLQQILFFRELEFPLAEIKAILAPRLTTVRGLWPPSGTCCGRNGLGWTASCLWWRTP